MKVAMFIILKKNLLFLPLILLVVKKKKKKIFRMNRTVIYKFNIFVKSNLWSNEPLHS